MKVTAIITIILSILSVTNVTAANRKSSERKEITPLGIVTIKESVTIMTESEINNKKIICEKNEQDQLLSKIVYLQDSNGEWTPFQRYQYNYSSDKANNPTSLSYLKWDRKASQWSYIKTINY